MKTHDDKNYPYSIRVIDRTIKLLECFLRPPNEYAMSELAQLSGFHITTVFRIIQTLQKHRYLAYDLHSHRYSLGIRLFELGEVVGRSSSLRKAASRHLDSLLAEVNHTILIGILEGGELVYIDKRDGNDPTNVTSEIGRRNPPYFGMLGKTLMAFLSDTEVDHLLSRFPLRKMAPRSITDVDKFKKSLQEIRRKGYTLQRSEAMEGIVGVAAPIRNHSGEVVAAAGTVFPSFNADEKKIKRVIRLVTGTMGEISSALGFPGSIGREGRMAQEGNAARKQRRTRAAYHTQS
jgi:IclR family transcriptional regulator, KDG regulon repressor